MAAVEAGFFFFYQGMRKGKTFTDLSSLLQRVCQTFEREKREFPSCMTEDEIRNYAGE